MDEYTEHQIAAMTERGITPTDASRFGIRPVTDHTQLPPGCPDYWTRENGHLPALLIPWVAADGRTEHQLRPDKPQRDADTGRPAKYLARSKDAGYRPVLWQAKAGDPDGVRLVVEGTFQTVAAALAAPEDVWVYGIFGCRGWQSGGTGIPDLGLLEGHRVVVALDADMWTNPNVWDAGAALRETLLSEGVAGVRFLKVAGSGKVGLDDYLATKAPERRTEALTRGIDAAKDEKFPHSRRPKRKREVSDSDRFFEEDAGLLATVLHKSISDERPLALTQENQVATYNGGVFDVEQNAFNSVVAKLLGDKYREAHVNTARSYAAATLYASNTVIPDRVGSPLLNCANGMLNLLNGEMLKHDPEYLSSTQIPVEYNEHALCPLYDEWIQQCAPDQVDILEEAVSVMLDPSRTPSKAVFLYGPSRSGKSTFLRLMQAIAGTKNCSSVTLHKLSEDKFAAAHVYNRMLNVAADIPSAHLEDISIFKMMSGEDRITADRKFGNQFTFVNRALFAFSANLPPTVGEASNAYGARVVPVKFPNSFEGNENPAIEDGMMANELPGILARWVRAYQRRIGRGKALGPHEAVRAEFDRQSDRVKQFYEECCELTEANDRGSYAEASVATGTQLAAAFKVWAEATNSRHVIGRNKLVERLGLLDGVLPVRDTSGRRGFNIRVLPQDDWRMPEQVAFVSSPGGGEVEKTVVPEETVTVPEVVEQPVFTEQNGHKPAAPVSTVDPLFPYPYTVDDLLDLACPLTAAEAACEDCGNRREHIPTGAGELGCPYCHPADFAWTIDDPYGKDMDKLERWPHRRCTCPDCPGGGRLQANGQR